MSGQDVVDITSHRDVRPAADVRRGQTTLITGCMFSGKTTWLLQALAQPPAGSAIAIRHRIDNRYRTDAIVSHDGRSFPAFTIGQAADLMRWHADPQLKLVAIDEIHFLDDSLLDVVQQLAKSGVDVMMAGLDRDSWGEPFSHMIRLSSAVTQTIECNGICARCGKIAHRTQRLTPIVNGRMVGGPESYESRCVRCWTPPPRDENQCAAYYKLVPFGER